jgi:predicted metalloendopeptidase
LHFYTNSILTKASELLKSLDLSADPCEDFYEYSSDGWMENNTISADKYRVFTLKFIMLNLNISGTADYSSMKFFA